MAIVVIAIITVAYHWTYLELKTAFGINKILNFKTAREIYDECNEKLAQPDHPVA